AVPWTYYEFDTFNQMFDVGSFIGYFPPGGTEFGNGFTLQVPVPFGNVLELDPPMVTVMNPKSVTAGNSFIINGVNFYPSLLESVLIGGKALDPANYMAINNQQIVVVAPNTPGKAMPVVVKTTQGISNTNATITITALQHSRRLADPGSLVRRRPS